MLKEELLETAQERNNSKSFGFLVWLDCFCPSTLLSFHISCFSVWTWAGFVRA